MVRNTALRLGAAGTCVASIHSNAFPRTLPEFTPTFRSSFFQSYRRHTFRQTALTKQKLALHETFVLALAEF